MIKKLVPHFLALLFFFFLACIYSSPTFSGKTLSMHDLNMAEGAAKELKTYNESTGTDAWWTNSMFGGMPSYMIYGNYQYSLVSKIGSFLYTVFPVVIYLLFALMACFYFMLITQKKNLYVAIIGAVAFAFGTYNLLYIEAGHISKILALAYGVGLIGGINLVFNGKYLAGTFFTSLFLAFELQANHLQITYYFFWIILALVIYQGVILFKSGKANQFQKIALCFIISLFIGIGSHTTRLWNASVYSSETTRGNSELTDTKNGKSGLDMEYAFGWSYGKSETFNLIIPNLYGGASEGALDTDSETYKTLTSGGVDPSQAKQFIKQLPIYFGEQSYTSGPAYVGILVAFLFILGLFFKGNKFQWLLFGMSIIAIFLSWGSNFISFNELVFNHLPGYNKFRAITMLLIMAHFLFSWGASNTLNQIIETELPDIKKYFGYTLAIFIVMFGVAFTSVNFQGPIDANLQSGLSQSLGADFANKVVNSLREDRSNMAISDIVRSLIFILLFGVASYFFYTKKLKTSFFTLIVLFLIMADEIGVDKRYFNNDDFISKSKAKNIFAPSPADEEILKDKDPDFRVFNSTASFLSEANTSYFHKSIGGYHGAKLKRYQEFVDNILIKDGNINFAALNLLNTKYIIVNGQNGVPMAQLNTNANGNAWFVEKLTAVKNADEEIKKLSEIDNKKEAVKVGGESLNFKVDSLSSTIKLTSYKPDELIYESNSNNDGYVVFSEMYYRGNVDWISSIDNKVIPHDRVDYILRGMQVPAGKHSIKFEFKPSGVHTGKYGDLIASILLISLFGLFVYSSVSGNKHTFL